MDITKCKIVYKQIVNDPNYIITFYHTILDEKNKVIKDALYKDQIIDINFDLLPSNIFDNIKLYLGKDLFTKNLCDKLDEMIIWDENDFKASLYLFGINLQSEIGQEILKYYDEYNKM